MAAELRLRDHVLLAVAQQRSLSKRLHSLAADLAAQDVVCCFDVIESCRAFLQEIEPDSTAQVGSSSAITVKVEELAADKLLSETDILSLLPASKGKPS